MIFGDYCCGWSYIFQIFSLCFGSSFQMLLKVSGYTGKGNPVCFRCFIFVAMHDTECAGCDFVSSVLNLFFGGMYRVRSLGENAIQI